MAFGFGKKKKNSVNTSDEFEPAAGTVAGDATEDSILDLPPNPADTAYEREVHGPLDESEVRKVGNVHSQTATTTMAPITRTAPAAMEAAYQRSWPVSLRLRAV